MATSRDHDGDARWFDKTRSSISRFISSAAV
jgi:hypothetical protein